jgi:cell division protein FtsW
MPRIARADRTLFGLTIALTVFGVVMVGSASSYYSLNQSGMTVSSQFLLRQILYACAGLFVMYRVMKIDYHIFARRSVVLGLVGGTTLLLLFVFLFGAHKGTHRWIPVGLFSLQPSELAKFTLAVFLAYMVHRKGEEINATAIGTMPSFGVAGLLAGLVLIEPDMGTAVLLMLVATLVLFAAGLRWQYVAAAGGTFAIALPILIFMAPYRAARMLAFMHPEQDLQGPNFQLFQSKIAIGSGGVLGSGLAFGQQKWLFLPESHTDFIYSVIGEELGLVGATVTLVLFLLFFWRGMRASLRAPDRFGTYLALGITLFVVCQAFINMGVATGLLPTKGMPLPFVSYGGSSLVVSLGMAGVLLNVSQQAG